MPRARPRAAVIVVRLLCVVLLAVVAWCSCVSDASAVKFFEPTGGDDGVSAIHEVSAGKYVVEFADGKLTELSGPDYEAVEYTIDNLYRDAAGEVALEGSYAGSWEDRETAEKIMEYLREAKVPVGDDGGRWFNFVDDLFESEQDLGYMPDLSALFDTALPITLIPAAAYDGYKIGTYLGGHFVDGWLGIPGKSEEHIEGGDSAGKVNLRWINSKSAECVELTDFNSPCETVPPSGVMIYTHPEQRGYNAGEYGWIQANRHWPENKETREHVCTPGEPAENAEFLLPPDHSQLFPEPPLLLSEPCGYPSEKLGNAENLWVGSVLGEKRAREMVNAGLNGVGWPQVEGFTERGEPELHETYAEPAKPAEIEAPLKLNIVTRNDEGASVPSPVPPIVTTEVIKETLKLKKEELPENPFAPHLPKPTPTETGTEFKERLEKEGWTHVELQTLPEVREDDSVGPEDVAYTSPAEETEVPFSDDVVIEQNPSGAPAGEGGITEPGFRVPSFGVLCEKFPFGVPCWLVSTMASWSAAAEAPEWTIPLESPTHGLIANFKLELKPLDSMMEKVRAAFLLVSTIGVVVAFFRWAIGGAGSDAGGDENE